MQAFFPCSKGLLAILVALVTLPPTLAGAEETPAESRVAAVTVYQGQALVTREVEIPSEEGLLELVITDLPAQIIPGSLYAEPGGGVEVRSVSFRQRPVQEDTREEVKQLDAEMLEIGDLMDAIRSKQTNLSTRKKYLSSLEKFMSGTGKSDLEHGVLDAAALASLKEMVFSDRDKIAEQELSLKRQLRDLNEKLSVVKRKRQNITGSASRTVREAIVFLNVPEQGNKSLRLTYLVSGASWSPSYNLRADEKKSEVVVEYNASVQQMSGEDWNDVAMTLSTATPSLMASAPRLDPLMIQLTSRRQSKSEEGLERSSLLNKQRMLAQNRGNYFFEMDSKLGVNANGVVDGWDQSNISSGIAAGRVPTARQSGSFGFGGGGSAGGGGGFGGVYVQLQQAAQADTSLNKIANDMIICDLTCPTSEVVLNKPKREADETEGLSIVYRLANRTSLPSRSDRQLIQIASMPIKAEFYHVAKPALTSYVFKEAKLTGGAKVVLLPGPAATFLGDRFVGRGEIPAVSIGQSFNVGLGIDESLRASRRLADRQERVQGGNRITKIEYQIGIENYGTEAVDVRLFARLPKSSGNDIKIQLVESDPAVQERAEQDDSEENGILRWDIEVPASATGVDRVNVEYAMQIEHDKNLTIVGMPKKN